MRAVELYRGDLLPGCFDEWIIPERERLFGQYLTALDQLLDLLEHRQSSPSAIIYAQRRLQHDPLHEQSYRRLMRLYASVQDRAAAVRVYQACCAALRTELGVDPSPATQALYAQALRLPPPPPVVDEALPTAGSAPLIGRAHALSQLVAAWQATAAGLPHVVLISGEAGIGKSRLARDLLAWAEHLGAVAAVTRAYAAEGGLPSAPVPRPRPCCRPPRSPPAAPRSASPCRSAPAAPASPRPSR